MRTPYLKNPLRKLRWISLLAQAGYWLDRFWQQLQSHGLLLRQLDAEA